ncbi:MAG TPA: F0F1 ATP synthase subunit B [Dehalococcoidia bacterium]|jgi:F-type H+-transporting ATPase subunit b|nr:F0F1 ATP synthase subunit B [Dehalococcoidia bacterium]
MVFLGITDLGINLPVLIGQTLSFTFLIVILRLLVYKPVLAMLDERRERIREGLSAADRGREQAVEAERAAQEQIEAARREGQNIVANAQQIAQRLQEEGRAQALQQQEVMLERARSEIQLERDAAISELRREFADLTITAAEKVIGQSLDRTAHQRLIDQALSESTFREN